MAMVNLLGGVLNVMERNSRSKLEAHRNWNALVHLRLCGVSRLSSGTCAVHGLTQSHNAIGRGRGFLKKLYFWCPGPYPGPPRAPTPAGVCGRAVPAGVSRAAQEATAPDCYRIATCDSGKLSYTHYSQE